MDAKKYRNLLFEDALGSILDGFGRLLGASGGPLGACWAPLGRFLGASWALLGASWELLGASWALPWKPPLLNLGTVGHQFGVSPVWCKKVL